MATSILDMLTDPATMNEACHAIVYGEPGCGKTATLDDPLLKVCLIDLEGGSVPLRGSKNVKRFDIPAMTLAYQIERNKPSLTEYEVLGELVVQIKNLKLQQFDMFAIDSFSKLEDMVKHYVATVYAPNRKREIQSKFGAQSDWGDLASLISATVDTFHTITKRGKHSRHVMWFAHVLKEKDEVSGRVLTTKIMLQGSKTPEVVMSRVDAFFYMYAKEVPATDKVASYIERGVLTKVANIYNSKVRMSKYDEPLPAVIKAPIWSEVFALMGYGTLADSTKQ